MSSHIFAASINGAGPINDGTITIEYPEFLITWLLVGAIGFAVGAIVLTVSKRKIQRVRASHARAVVDITVADVRANAPVIQLRAM